MQDPRQVLLSLEAEVAALDRLRQALHAGKAGVPCCWMAAQLLACLPGCPLAWLPTNHQQGNRRCHANAVMPTEVNRLPCVPRSYSVTFLVCPTDVVDLKREHQRAQRARTLMGHLENLMGYILSLYCIYRWG